MRKKLLCVLLFFLISLTVIPINASCTTITYYSRKDWVGKQEFIDVPFNTGDSNFIQSDDIVTHMNILGTHSKPLLQSSSVVTGGESFSVDGNINPNDKPYFQMDMGKTIQVNEFEFDIQGNSTNGTAKEKVVYVNARMDWVNGVATIISGKEIFRSSTNSRIKLNLGNEEIYNIYIVFSDLKEDDKLTFNYFQINTYSVYDHVEWTTDYIPNTETKTESYCLNSGKFTPNGTLYWQKTANTVFSPSASIISDYQPILTSQTTSTDYGRGSYIPAFSNPDVVKNMGGYAAQIEGWTNTPLDWEYTREYFSYGNGGIDFPWIMTGSQTGVRYQAYPVYWSQTKGLANYVWADSWDAGWCQHTTGSSQVPCYKYGGHSSNSRLNSWDVNILTYKNIVEPSQQIVVEANYYLINMDTGQQTWLKKTANEAASFSLNDSGKWKIKAVLKDGAGNTGEKTSDIFCVDNTAPWTTFSPNEVQESSENIIVNINNLDVHSGVKKWRYSLSTDGGISFNEYSDYITTSEYKLLLNENGSFQIKVEVIDNADNSSINKSGIFNISKADPSISKMYSFSYDENANTDLHVRLTTNHEMSEQVEVITKQDGNIIKTELILLSNNLDYIVPYRSNTEETNLSVVLKYDKDTVPTNNELSLTVYKKTYAEKETDLEQLEFNAIVASTVEQESRQKNFQEHLILNMLQDNKDIFAGQGIEIKVNIQYENECSEVVDYVCKANNILTESYHQFALFPQGAAPAKDKYLVNGKYKIPLYFSDNSFNLPEFWVGKETGKVFISRSETTSEEALEGGHKWYTDLRSDLKKYPFNIIGNNIGFNRFTWQFNGFFNVTELYSDQYRIRFVDPDNVFPSGKSNVWSVYEDWFMSLDKNKSIHSIEIKEK